MTRTMILNSIFIAFIALPSLFSMSACEANINGFTINMIHRDSPQSPSYDPSLSPTERIVKALKRSFYRVQRFKTKDSPESDVIPTDGAYVMEYSLGSPPVPSVGIADTGSDLIWTQCQPCVQCFDQALPFFSPANSSTYRTLPCNTPKCRSFPETTCDTTTKNCRYSSFYGDGSYSQGEVATETFTLTTTGGKSLSIRNIGFGCGLNNGGQFSGIESGIVGLGGGTASLVTQLGPLAQGKFSYCLLPLTSESNSSKLSFGAKGEVSGRDVVSTYLVRKEPDTFYYLTMEGISVGNQRQEVSDSEEGNMIIDSGTTLTFLPAGLYTKLEKALIRSINSTRIPDPARALDLCYFATDDAQLRSPEITVHFKGADLKLKQDNTFIRTSNTSLCLAFAPANGAGIYGNMAQMNFLVGYDLQSRTVSFKPTDCGNY